MVKPDETEMTSTQRRMLRHLFPVFRSLTPEKFQMNRATANRLIGAELGRRTGREGESLR